MTRLVERWRHSRSEDGQVLVIVGVGLVGFIAMVGLVIDGGSAWGQQRKAQNGADAVAMAGTVVVQHHLARIETPVPTDGDVGCAVRDAALANDVTVESAVYTDWDGDPLGVSVGGCGSGGVVPSGAQGVKATTARIADTYFMGIVGFTQITVRADATAIVGTPGGICPADLGCATLPVTFPQTMDTCDGTNHREIGKAEWTILNPDAGHVLDSTNLSNVPLCSTGPGSVGWLDHDCGNLQTQIETPCHGPIDIPAWLHTSTGNPNCCELDLSDYAGPTVGVAEPSDQVIYIPIHDNTCRTRPADDNPNCPSGDWSGSGDLLYYHVPYWVGFKVDAAYTSGGDAECQQLPGNPSAAGNGATGCLKGWFVGRLDAPGTVRATEIVPGSAVTMSIALVN